MLFPLVHVFHTPASFNNFCGNNMLLYSVENPGSAIGYSNILSLQAAKNAVQTDPRCAWLRQGSKRSFSPLSPEYIEQLRMKSLDHRLTGNGANQCLFFEKNRSNSRFPPPPWALAPTLYEEFRQNPNQAYLSLCDYYCGYLFKTIIRYNNQSSK